MKNILLSATLLLTAAACTRAAHLQTPAGFAELGDQHAYDYRATTAQGVVVAVRTEKNSLHAPADFWTQAIDARLRQGGYVAESAKDVIAPSGLVGKQVRYTREAEDRRTYAYWLTVFATKEHVYVVEAGGDKELFEPAMPALEQAVASLRVD